MNSTKKLIQIMYDNTTLTETGQKTRYACFPSNDKDTQNALFKNVLWIKKADMGCYLDGTAEEHHQNLKKYNVLKELYGSDFAIKAFGERVADWPFTQIHKMREWNRAHYAMPDCNRENEKLWLKQFAEAIHDIKEVGGERILRRTLERTSASCHFVNCLFDYILSKCDSVYLSCGISVKIVGKGGSIYPDSNMVYNTLSVKTIKNKLTFFMYEKTYPSRKKPFTRKAKFILQNGKFVEVK